MALTSTDKALTVARLGAARLGAARLGFAPTHSREAAIGSTSGPLVRWVAVERPTTTWTLSEPE